VTSTFFGLSFDSHDAAAVAAFWADVLGGSVAAGASSANAVVEASDSRPRIAFHHVPEGKTVKNRLHIDVVAGDFDAECERLLRLGARRITDLVDGGARWATFADVEGNEFDVIAG
jgi:predicted enzyme related to lactoylglutathione lyase